MSYYFLKIIHIIGASMLIGSFFMTPLYNFAYHRSKFCKESLSIIGKILTILTLTALLVQPISGFMIIAIRHYNPMSVWVMGALGLFALVGCVGLAMIYLQQKKPLCQAILLTLSAPIFFLLYYFMVNIPN